MVIYVVKFRETVGFDRKGIWLIGHSLSPFWRKGEKFTCSRPTRLLFLHRLAYTHLILCRRKLQKSCETKLQIPSNPPHLHQNGQSKMLLWCHHRWSRRRSHCHGGKVYKSGRFWGFCRGLFHVANVGFYVADQLLKRLKGAVAGWNSKANCLFLVL